MVDVLEAKVGGFQGKRILDLGGGPGQFAVEFAKRGGLVTWHDISKHYSLIVEELAKANGVELALSLGYMEEASKFVGHPFDLVFNRICWMYCVNDFEFAKLIHDLIRPGGWGYVNSDYWIENMAASLRFRYAINAHTGIKIGHIIPPPGRLEKYFRGFGDLDVEVVVNPPKENLFLNKRIEPR
jgi:SAM-dependent methyltransferase